jgi:hypothetical protein
MIVVKRDEVERKALPGRMIQLVVGTKDAVSSSEVMTMGFATYSSASGPMEPHHHVEEIVYVLRAEKGWVRHGGAGAAPDELGAPIPLSEGMILHIPDQEWHVFEYDEGGFIEIVFFYAQPDVYGRK